MHRRSLRHFLELAVGVLVALALVRTWVALGLVVPVTVAGSSMAPTLRGPHRAFQCPDCRGSFTVGLDEEPDDFRAVCPACGSRRAAATGDALQAGDRLIVRRAAFAWRQPRRWEVVVFRCPQQADQLCVKRVVGLPGERVALAHGDVLVDGQLVRKTLAEQQALRQLVHRADIRAPLTSPDGAAWKTKLVPFADAMLTAQVQLEDNGRLRVVIDGNAGRFDMSCDAVAHRIELRRDGRLLATQPFAAETMILGFPAEWTFSLFDRQALVAVDDRVVLVVPYEVSNQPPRTAFPPPAKPTNVAIYGLHGTIAEPTVWRDAYYEYRYGDGPPVDSAASRTSASAAAAWSLGSHEYFVLGDNAEISDDSRSWLAGPGLDAKLLIGKPLGVR